MVERVCRPEGAAVAFDSVTVTLGKSLVLDGVTARVPRGSCTAVVGPNGAGKTTLLLALLGEVPHTGSIRVSPRNGGGRLRIGYVPQRLQFDRGMPLTVLEFMVMGRQRLPLWFGALRAHRDRARELLKSVKAEALAERAIGALSGGEMQRVLLALALGQEPDLLVLDEPAAGVDFQGEHLFCELLDQLRCDLGFTQLMVSHDLATVTHHASHAICINRRVAAEGPPGEVLTAETLTAIFGIQMGMVDSSALPDKGCIHPFGCGRGGDGHA